MKYFIRDTLRLICSFIYHILWFLFFIVIIGISIICLPHYIGTRELPKLNTEEMMVLAVGFLMWIVLVKLSRYWKNALKSELPHYLSMLYLQELIILFNGNISVGDNYRVYKHGIGYCTLNGSVLTPPEEARDSTRYIRIVTVDNIHALIYRSQVDNEGEIMEQIKKVISDRADK